MAVTNTDDSNTTTTAVVTIRIPHGADDDLVADAEKRLSRIEHLDSVTVTELHRLEPKLSATLITIEITLRWTTAMNDATLSERLGEVTGIESIERV